MKKWITILSLAVLLVAALATATLVGCGTSTETSDEEVTEPESTTPESTEPGSSSESEDRKALEELVEAESAGGEDFDRNTYEKVEFAEDASGTQWALVEATTYTKSDPENGTTQTYIFSKADGEWKLISNGTSGYSEGVPTEVQEEFNIVGQ